MSFFKPLSTMMFEQHLYDMFVERVEQCQNNKALLFILTFDTMTIGVECKSCHVVKPIYCYGQKKSNTTGINFSKCTKCYTNNQCPFKGMINCMKWRSNRRGHDDIEFTVDDLKKMYEKQKGKCFISGDVMKIKRGDGDPYNMSPERLNNGIGYVKGNVVLICVYLQIAQDYSPTEIRSWYHYDKSNDNFVFDPSIFNKPESIYRKRRRVTRQVNKKTCTDCNEMLYLNMFCGKKSYCKHCNIKRLKKYGNTPYGFMKKIVRGSKGSAKRRSSKRKRNDDSGKCDDDLFSLFVKIVTKQGGRCAKTGIPFVYKSCHKFSPSPDRLDNSKGYVDGNIRFIITPLNTRYRKD